MRVIIISLIGLLILTACGPDETSLPYADLPETGDAARGERLFSAATNGSTPCTGCHVEGAQGAPDLVHYGAVAGTRVAGQDAHEYTFYAIVEPGQYIVEGYGNAMPADYDERLAPQDIADMIAYLLGL